MAFKKVIQYIENITGKAKDVKDTQPLPTLKYDFSHEPADFYLYQLVKTVVPTSDVVIGDSIINVEDTTDVVLGHAITFYEGGRKYQSLVKAKTASTITVGSPIDYAYTTEAVIETGIWNMAVDGSATTQIFSIKAPMDRSIMIHTINCSLLDSSDMDDGRFGGIPALTNGIIFRFVDGIKKNLALIVSNLGFWEIGFATEYTAKAPAGQYGFKARRYVPKTNGVVVKLEKGMSSKFEVHIQDDLTDLDLMAVTIDGYFITD